MAEHSSRYARQTLLPGIGAEGQRRLGEATALVLGCGALGTVVAELLARAGVGRLVIVDRDVVELSNLQRQMLYDEHDIADALPKAEAARRRLARVNSEVRVEAVVDDIDATNIEALVRGADVLVDGLDNFETRYLANDAAVKHGVPYIYAGAVGTAGMACAILPYTRGGTAPWERADGAGATPCLRCLFDEIPAPGTLPTCETAGVLGPLTSLIASFEAAEALKVLTRNFDRVGRRLLEVDLWDGTFRRLDVSRAYEAADCVCCRHAHYEFLDGTRGAGASVLCGADAVQVRPAHGAAAVDLEAVAARLRRHGSVAASAYMIRAAVTDHGRAYELTLFPDGRAIVKGTREASVARGVYARHVGT